MAFGSGGDGATDWPPVEATKKAPEPINLLDRTAGYGLQVDYWYPRTESLVSPSTITVRMRLQNFLQAPLSNIEMSSSKLVHGFEKVAELAAGLCVECNAYFDFQDKQQPAKFTISHDNNSFPVSITPKVGELVKPFQMTEQEFASSQGKLGGMYENRRRLTFKSKAARAAAPARMWRAVNVARVASKDSNVMLFAGKTVGAGTLVLFKVELAPEEEGRLECTCTANTADMLLGVMMLDDVKHALSQ